MQTTAGVPAREDLFRVVKRLNKEGRAVEALGCLREYLRRGDLDAGKVERAGRLVRTALLNGAIDGCPLRVLILGQVTTSWLIPSLTAVAWGRGTAALVEEGGYDTVLQDLSACSSGDEAPDVVVFLPWSQHLLSGAEAPTSLIEAELTFWQRAWDLATGRLGARVLQVGYDWVIPGPLGYSLAGAGGGPIDLVDQMNAALRQHLPRGAYFLDLGQVSGTAGRLTFYDMRRYYWTKQPFGEEGLLRLTEHLWAGVRALTIGPKKVVVLDLDNTLWGGVVGETGPFEVVLGDSPDGEAYRRFQQYLKGLAGRGIVLAIASKNNPADALEVFEKNRDMVLRLDDFGAYEICWEPKGTTIARLAQTLNLGLESFVFFDDNPAEREQVRQALPAVEVVEVPEDPAEYARVLQEGLYFETIGLTEEDRQRTVQYAVERKRRALEESSASLDDYLRSLEMCGEVRPIDEADLPRVEQLFAKTNQFNLTTRRHGRETVCELLAAPNSVGVTLRLRDRFGDHGLVAVMIVVPIGQASATVARIDTWLMSCRVIGRTAEQFLFGVMLQRCRALGYRRIIGEYIPTNKNALVATFYSGLGFRQTGGGEGDGSSVFYELVVDGASRPEAFIRDDSPTGSDSDTVSSGARSVAV
jgi:FkbH-like protein